MVYSWLSWYARIGEFVLGPARSGLMAPRRGPDKPPTEANQHQTRCTANGFTTDPVDRITAARLINTHAKARHVVHDPG
jgi:hypothetical protein